ncbi:hypothetical protein [Conexibacter woesei]|uniref:Uncharacterized protein n=1 Tax=Conexibacter woesei (strain DSM 14684 / CCUG 47730 / CIP 108061 / JCM 11494 / NBRC 100937 / ID131577) TaxID=469383 RepID=D3FAA5_CONWI|nr:hypothetical protein [Conexibacter woesei]ADB49174.1 hypothetical protein Cwoe_0741 [Conexibacter woesei DSM 14684]
MNARNLILGASLVLIAALAFFTLRDFAVNGVTAMGVVSLPIVVLLAVGVIGAMAQPPRRK